MAGSLIEFHTHGNLDILQHLSEMDSVLYYRGKKVSSELQVSGEAGNAVTKKEDGLYVNAGLMLSDTEKKMLSRLSISDSFGLMLDNEQVGHSHENKSVLDELSDDTSKGLLYKGKQVGHSHTNKAVLEKFSVDEDGILLYNGSKIKTDIKVSEEKDNAIQETEKGLYVKDKSQEIADVSEKVEEADTKVNQILDDIEKGKTFLNIDLDWLILRSTGVQHPIVNNELCPNESDGTLKYNNNHVVLKPDRTYFINMVLRVDGGSQLCYTIQDVDTLECFGSGFANASSFQTNYGEQSLSCIIKTGEAGMTVRLHVFDQTGEPTYQGLNCSFVEIGRGFVSPSGINGIGGADVPTGTIIAFMGNIPPEHYLACDGQEYNISDYPELSGHIEKQFGTVDYFGGDGIDTFAVPDLRGEFLRGTGVNSHANQGNGTDVGKHQDATEHNNVAVWTANNTNRIFVDSQKIDRQYIKNADSSKQVNAGYSQIILSDVSDINPRMQTFASRPTNTSVLWCIKCETGNNTNQNVYSADDEIPVGTWIDGKTIYRKVYANDNALPYGLIDTGMTGVDQLVHAYGTFKNSGNASVNFPLGGVSNNRIYVSVKNNDIMVQCERNIGDHSPRWVFEYTKIS